jgi:hypothetical protein
MALLIVGAAMGVQGLRPLRGQIVWDGQWHWQSKGYPAGTVLAWPQVVWDGQCLMLVRLCNADGACWMLWLDADTQPQHWLDLRRALLARPPALEQALMLDSR